MATLLTGPPSRVSRRPGGPERGAAPGGVTAAEGHRPAGRHSVPRHLAARRYPATAPPRAATLLHGASLVGAFVFWAWLDRGLWFFGDDWDFLVRRGLAYPPTDPRSIWFPHNEHWSTLPVLLWRALYNTFHLGSYWPYLVPVLVAQVLVMHLAWRISLRAGANVWVATAAVAVLGFLGAGAEDLAWAFQIGFVGSVLFGLFAIDLLDRPATGGRGPGHLGPVHLGHSHLVLASLSLLASLMCSTIGDAMVAGAAVLAFARLPWRRALSVLALPVVAYVTWFAGVGRLGLSAHSDRFTLRTATGLPRFMWDGLTWALGRSFNLQAAGPAILVAIIAWVAWRAPARLREQPVLVALPAATISFYFLVAIGRDTSSATAAVSRYAYVAFALLTPVIATLLSGPRAAPAKTTRAVHLGAIAVLAVTLAGNVGQAQTWVNQRHALTSKLETEVMALGRLSAAGVEDVAGANAAPISYFPDLSAVRLAGLERSHLLPPASLTPLDLVNARALLAVGDWNGAAMALSPHPLAVGHFEYVGYRRARVASRGGGCFSFSPVGPSSVQVWLRVPAGQKSAAVLVKAPPEARHAARYLAAFIVPPHGPSSSVPVNLVVPPTGTGYLTDNDSGAKLVLTWTEGTVLRLCDISPAK